MKRLTLVAALLAVAFVAAVEPPPFDIHKKAVTPEEKAQRKAYFEKRFLEHTGGRILRPGTRKGTVYYINCQKRAQADWLEESRDYMAGYSKFNVAIKDGEFDLAAPKVEGNASLFVVDDDKLPPILVAPESRWAIVNVAPLAKDAKPAFFEARVTQALTRGFCFLCGASNSQFPRALTGGVTGPADLDKFPDYRLPVDIEKRMASYMEPFGVTPAVMATYRQACKEGWAPAPANDYQKQVAEAIAKEKAETLKGPKSPRKIVFDPKKGE
jgi:hypothetical protein